MMKKALIIFGSVIAVLILFAAGYFVVMKHEMKKMHTVETGQVTDHIYAIKDSFVDAYLIGSPDGDYIMIDAGNDTETIKAALSGLNIDPAKVRAIFLTHTDRDHVAAIPLFTNAEVFLSRQEEQMINGETSRFFVFGNKISRKDYQLLDDGQVIDLPGITIKGILSPGHTPGAMCYLVNQKYLFTGDVLSLKNGKVDEFSKFINMDTKTDRKSIDRLSHLEGVEYIFTAHHGVSNDFEAAFKDWGK
jgi:glyoxylase-like metal-dependent hydrolase (beta-lactamase superfamily II)